MKLQENNALITKKFFLDWSKWRCGGREGENVLGKGETSLLNDQGFLCCLGQCSLQLGVPEENIRGWAEPRDVKTQIPVLTITNQIEHEQQYDEEHMDVVEPFIEVEEDNTSLSQEAMDINDNRETTPEQKIELLQELFATEGYQIEVINKPV